MKPYLVHTVRLYPTSEQKGLFTKTTGCCRWLYNHLIEFKNQEYRRFVKERDSNTDFDPKAFKWKPLPTEKELKAEYLWLKEVNAQALVASRCDLQDAFNRFFKGQTKWPVFHKRGQKESFRVTQSSRLENQSLYLVKYGHVSIRGDLSQLRGRVKSVTVKRVAGKWYASILQEVEASDYYQPTKHKHEAVGIDLGVVNPLTLTNGTSFKVAGRETRQHLKMLEVRRKRYQRQLARKTKGSNNRNKARLRVARAYQREAYYRKNFQHQVSHRLTASAQTLVFEDLKISNMTKSAKGTVENPGTNVRAKSGLNRELLRLGLTGLVKKCQYKAHRRGGTVVFVDPRHTSQTCSDCGTIDKLSRKSQARFLCVHCGFKLNADQNASLNILARGLAIVQ